MPPKKGKEKEEPKEELPPEEPPEPPEPEVAKRCFRAGGTLYYGDCKAGGKERAGTFVRHGFGRQIDLAAAPAGRRFSDNMAYETVVLGTYEGNWDEDMMSGQGTYKWSDSGSYEGGFAEGRLSGHGRFVWPDGSAYEGAWLAGSMNGQGRLDSRFDGKFHQGKFHRNCFQMSSGRWVDILDKSRKAEQKRALEGDAGGMQVRRCAFGARFGGGARQQAVEEQREALLKALETIQSEGFVPLIAAEASLAGSALDCLASTGLCDLSRHAVSPRLAAVAKRRLRDCHHFFYEAIRCSLQEGAFFAVAFEDDEEGLGMTSVEQDDWWARKPTAAVPQGAVPEAWRLSEFFSPTNFPEHIFQPLLFNGRNLATATFLPEVAQQQQQQQLQRRRLSGPLSPAGDAGDAGGAGPAEAEEAEGDQTKAAAGDEEAPAAAKQLLAEAARGVSAGMVGQTGHFFEEVEGIGPEAAGLPLAHCLRPVICAAGRLPDGLADEEVQGAVVSRFGRHVPLHRTVLLLLGNGEEVPETLT